jgi:hypothetical protein
MNALNHSREFNKHIGARVDVVKAYLTGHISENMDATDDGAIAIALLEMAVDRFIHRYGEQSANNFVATIFRKTVNGRHSTGQ